MAVRRARLTQRRGSHLARTAWLRSQPIWCAASPRSTAAMRRAMTARYPAPARSTCCWAGRSVHWSFFEPALEVNPNLQGPAEMVPKLQELVRGQGRHST